jgi:MraZ protein
VVAEFIGKADHSLDTKGRVILPAIFRPAFDSGGYLTADQGGCLALWTPTRYEQEKQRKLERAATGGLDGLEEMRVWSADSYHVQVDRQGRMPIPADLREFAGLESGVRITGALDHVELWNPESYDEMAAEVKRRLGQRAGRAR